MRVNHAVKHAPSGAGTKRMSGMSRHGPKTNCGTSNNARTRSMPLVRAQYPAGISRHRFLGRRVNPTVPEGINSRKQIKNLLCGITVHPMLLEESDIVFLSLNIITAQRIIAVTQ